MTAVRDKLGTKEAARKAWQQARKAEQGYAAELRKVARAVGDIVRGSPSDPDAVATALHRYAEIVRPWARAAGQRMLAQVARGDRKAWEQHTGEIGRALRRELAEEPTGLAVQELLSRQVDLISSLPRQAADRVQKLALDAVTAGKRPENIVSEILETGDVTLSRAKLIARTETGRASTAITQARATRAGSQGYIWRTCEDGDVRPSHRAMNGKMVRWDSPPTLDKMRGHAGSLVGCRCYCEPVL